MRSIAARPAAKRLAILLLRIVSVRYDAAIPLMLSAAFGRKLAPEPYVSRQSGLTKTCQATEFPKIAVADQKWFEVAVDNLAHIGNQQLRWPALNLLRAEHRGESRKLYVALRTSGAGVRKSDGFSS
jgi:hypothetical protein